MGTKSSTLIGAAVAVALLKQAAPAYAASTASGEIEEVIVTGIRGSLRESLETKREATAVVDAITAEDVGKFPDKNLAEALQRVPGIVINREFGEGERVSLRGTAPNLSRTLLNGHGVGTADWFILDQQAATRSFNFLMLPADIIGKVEVYKSPQADMEEGGLGGTINVSTRNPLDLKANTAYVSAQGAHMELADETSPQVNALYSWKNGADTFGVLFAGIYQKREIRRDGVETFGYADQTTAGQTVKTPTLIGSSFFNQERVRKGGNFGVQFRPNDQLDFNLTGLFSRFEADNVNQNFLAHIASALGGPGGGQPGSLTNAVIVNGVAVAGTVNQSPDVAADGGGHGVFFDAIVREAHTETKDISLDTNYRVSDALSLHFKVGYSDAEGFTDNQPFVELSGPASLNYDLRGRSPAVQFTNIDPTDLSSQAFTFGSSHEIGNDDTEAYAYLDAETKLDAGALSSLKFGVKYTDHEREATFNATNGNIFRGPLALAPGSTFAGGLTPGDFEDGIGAPGTLSVYRLMDPSTIRALLSERLAQVGRTPYPQQEFSVTEKAYAGYVMGNLKGEGWRGNAGVRFVRTEQESTGAFSHAGGSISNPFGSFDPISAEQTYNDWLPSVNVVYDIRQNLLLRGAVARVMARPDYTDISPVTVLNQGALSGRSGNPNIDPFRANQADLSLEWYPDDNTILAAALYYKDVKSFVTDTVRTQNFLIQTTNPGPGCVAATPGFFDCPFTINVRSNGGGGRIQGVEVALTKPLWGGFGVQTNYTYADAETDAGDPLPGTSEDQFNLTAYFENERVSARLAYTYRSEFFITFDRTSSLNQESLESLDASLVVGLTDNLAVTFDAVNLTNDKIEQFTPIGGLKLPRGSFDNGRMYFAGARLKF